MGRTIFILSITLAATLDSAAPTVSKKSETAKDLWIKAKCALCHGEDGASNTPTGRKTEAPDLKSTDVQQMSDERLMECIEKGHQKMPSFEVQLSDEEIKVLLQYIRQMGKPAPK